MAPKSTPSAVKQNLILTYLQNSGTVHNIKELEKALPSIASINGMQVKDFLQALWDDDKIRVEKIGSGNWYWSFANETKKAKQYLMESLQADKEKVTASVTELHNKLEAAKAEESHEDESNGKGPDRTTLMQMRSTLQQEVDSLLIEVTSYSDHDPAEAEKQKQRTVAHRATAERWTDNIYSLEQYYQELTGRDPTALEQIRQMCYGDDYREGEGLAEL